VLYGALGEEAKALDFLQQAQVIFREAKSSMGEGKVLSELGFGFYLRGDYRRSLALYEQALPLSRDGGDFAGTGRALMALGVNYAFSRRA
jgi:tetratricopeptide (TPR) repeat protein